MEPRCEHRGEVCAGQVCVGQDRASMEPRCEHRGEIVSVRYPPFFEPWLQWSRGANTAESRHAMHAHCTHESFNGAAVRTPRRASYAARRSMQAERLQWSRGANTAERGCHRGGGPRRKRASMEPRCEHRGESSDGNAEHLDESRASMEPRCEHRGESSRTASVTTRTRLQWSRGANTAER